MPLYDFTCPTHGTSERIVPLDERDAQVCECGQPMTRDLSRNVTPHFKGSGFYATDYPKNA